LYVGKYNISLHVRLQIALERFCKILVITYSGYGPAAGFFGDGDLIKAYVTAKNVLTN
jgi:hypothetical protein